MTEHELHDTFAAHAAVQEARIIRAPQSGQSRGIRFVTLMMASAAESAIAALDGIELRGRKIRVEIAKERENRGRGHGSGGRHKLY